MGSFTGSSHRIAFVRRGIESGLMYVALTSGPVSTAAVPAAAVTAWACPAVGKQGPEGPDGRHCRGYTHEDMRPVIQDVIETFTWETGENQK